MVNDNGKVIIRISILWLFVLAIIITSIISFFKNDIFAANNEEPDTEETIAIEPNENKVDILNLMIENNYENKKLINEERTINFESITYKTDKLPKGEKKEGQKGVVGKKQVTAMQTYQDETYQQEDIIEENIIIEPITEIILEGTSEYLNKYKVHIGDEMYLIESGDIKKEKNNESENVYSIKRYLNVELVEVLDSEEWAKIKYKDYEGYIEKSKLTSEEVTPKIKEKNRIAILQSTLNEEMDLSQPSGLTLSDYITVFKNNSSDKNKIFEENAKVFYEIEEEYNINGIFLAAIGIHESGWGTSTIAKEKYNLFGYKAYDRDPGKYAQQFESYEDCIKVVGKAVANNYLSETGSFYNGTSLESVNKKYASDKEWHKKVYKYMEYLYEKLG